MMTGFGLIGCGQVAALHAAAIREIPGAVLRGAYDSAPAFGAQFCATHQIQQYDTIDALLHAPDIDAVCICTPSGLHKTQCLQAAAAGKHIVVEKPMALNTADCDAVIDAAAKAGVKLAVISQYRFSQGCNVLKTAVDGGALGRIVLADLSMKYYRSQAYYDSGGWRGTWAMDGGGALMNQGIHGIDQLLYVCGPVQRVYGCARTLARQIEVEDTAVATVEFASGALGVITGTTSVSPGYPRSLSVSGTNGTVAISESAVTLWDVEGHPLPEGVTLGGAVKSGARVPMNLQTDGHKNQIADLVAAIREDRAPRVGGADARRAVALICAIYRASESGACITLDA